MDEREKIIERLEKRKNTRQDFYKKHPELLEKLEYKINHLKNGGEYEVTDAGWAIVYIASCMAGVQTLDVNKKQMLKDVKLTELTVDEAKKLYEDLKQEMNLKKHKK